VVSPLQFWAMQYYWVHMLQHVSLMLAAPALYVAGAPLLPLIHSVPVKIRRRVLRSIFIRSRRHPLRYVGAFLLSPLTGIVLFNAIMILWMVPPLFNNIMMHEELHINLMLSSFFVSGVLFWIHFIPSRPLHSKLSGPGQIVALLSTNAIMTFIAIASSFLASGAWYDFGAAMGHMSSMGGMVMGGIGAPTITLNRFADQQIGAAILWVCGDFWCYPALSIAIQRTMAEGNRPSKDSSLFRPQRNMSAEEFLAARSAPGDISQDENAPGLNN
jgi:cytochrome c oxidase assembly factor CtaG